MIKKIGNAFEQSFARLLANNGFWVMRIPDDRQGQPFDIIAAKDGVSYAFECKTCQNGRFGLRRVEVNQRYAIKSYMDSGNSHAYFSFLYNNKIYIAKAKEVLDAKKTIDIRTFMGIGDWIENTNKQ